MRRRTGVFVSFGVGDTFSEEFNFKGSERTDWSVHGRDTVTGTRYFQLVS